jgi:hypothetical protein
VPLPKAQKWLKMKVTCVIHWAKNEASETTMSVNERFAQQFVVAESITGRVKNNRNMILRLVKITKKIT